MTARDYYPGVGQAVADRTINRPNEKWADVARRVALGNSMLASGDFDRSPLEAAIADGRILLSGRHLQHGDENQPRRNMEVFTNCSTGSQRSIIFYLLLNGSGVGSSYDDDIQIVDWTKMPEVFLVLDSDHADYDAEAGWLQLSDAIDLAEDGSVIFEVPDSREGWAEAIMFVESQTYLGDPRPIILDFSRVRPKGSPIGGMQSRPSSGPVPLMEALRTVGDRLRGKVGIDLWEQAMILDHHFAEIVLVGGARRAARIAVKWWADAGIFKFINIKQTGGLWTANNSVGVDAEFWSLVNEAYDPEVTPSLKAIHARNVFEAVITAQYEHGTGEPAFLNMDLLSRGETPPTEEEALHLSGKLKMSETAIQLRRDLMARAANKKYCVIVNPCGEIRLSVNGGYCVIGDAAVAHCETQEQFVEAVELITRALIRTNTMPALYQGEVRRTNRIGVALTGIHEYAWNRFGLSFRDLVEADETTSIVDANGNKMPAPSQKAWPFWASLADAALAVGDEAIRYSQELGVKAPVTSRTIKPAGTTSKLFCLTEGAHLPAMGFYLRWVQFREDDPLVADYEAKGYPIRRNLPSYKNVVIVGFPTSLPLAEVMGDKLVTAPEATFEEQIRWIRLLETYWLLPEGGNQISYTLKYDPKDVTKEAYSDLVRTHVPFVRAVSVMPVVDQSAYDYQPEEAISREDYERLITNIERAEREEIGREHLQCDNGACPIDFMENEPA